MNESKYFLPYQIRWIKDDSRIKIWEKSRRIGATYAQSYEDVEDCVAGRVPSVWFSSADETAAKEYIDYCAKWVKVFDCGARALGQVVIDSDKNIKAFVIEFKNGRKIHALSSNPKAFRSKGGKVVLDEFAFHDDAKSMWAAARPCITWGYPLRILSTHNGQQCQYYKFLKDAKAGKLKWAVHTTDIFLAVEEGLVDKILKHKATQKEKEEWIENEQTSCGDDTTWQQEYCCKAIDEATAFLTYDLISSCEAHDLIMPIRDCTGDLYLGFDVARKKDLSVIWILEKLGRVLYTREIKEMPKTKFKIQREILFERLRHPKMRRGCIDATGLGMQLAEEAQTEFGKYRVEAITFTGKVKEELAYPFKTRFEDRTIIIPSEMTLREDLHSVRKITTGAGNTRFDVASNENLDSHADRFWSGALANHACTNEGGPLTVTTRGRRELAAKIEKDYLTDSNITSGY